MYKLRPIGARFVQADAWLVAANSHSAGRHTLSLADGQAGGLCKAEEVVLHLSGAAPARARAR